MRKKILCIIMAIFMCFSFSACGNTDTKKMSKESAEELFIETMEKIYEKNVIVCSFQSTIINKMMEMEEDGRLSDFFLVPIFCNEDMVSSFEEYESIYQERPDVAAAECYDIMTTYFNIHSQEDLDNWLNRCTITSKVYAELEPLGKDLVSCKEYIDEDCFDAAMNYYESTRKLASKLFPQNEDDAAPFLEDCLEYTKQTIELSEKINLYYELNPDYESIINESLGK